MAKRKQYLHDTKENAAYLSEVTDIPINVCMAWLRSEPQDVDNPTNPLNIIRHPHNVMQIGASGMYATYHTTEDGLRDVATQLQSPKFELLILAIRSHDPFRIAKAIEVSPWNNTHYGAKYPVTDGLVVKNYLRLARATKSKGKFHPAP